MTCAVSLTKTDKKTRSQKSELVDKVRESVDEYKYVYVFSVDNMRNAYLKQVRHEWNDSRCGIAAINWR